MSEHDLVVAPPGWFADPTGLSELRWWSGADWTEHVATRPVLHPADIPRPGTVLSGAPATRAVHETLAPSHPTAPAYVPFAHGGRSGHSPGADPRAWTPDAGPAPARWNTGGAWALSATPWIGVLGGVGLAFSWSISSSRSWWWSLAVGLLPLLWSIAAATRDRRSLDEFGYRQCPSLWWLVLGPLGYLIARTVQVRRQSGHGSAPLWWYLVNITIPFVAVIALDLLLFGLRGGLPGARIL